MGRMRTFLSPLIETVADLVVPTLSLSEVFKNAPQQRAEGAALQAVAVIIQGKVVDLDMDLAGTWTLDQNDGSVAFEHASDTFLRDMTFSYSNSRLSGEATFSGVTINVVLRK